MARPAGQGQAGPHRCNTPALTEAFVTRVKVAFWAACFVSFPLIANQVWLFVAPGLYKNERMAFMPYLVATPVLFFMGGALVYYMIFPAAWHFFLSFAEQTATPDTLAIEAGAEDQRVPSVADLDPDLRVRLSPFRCRWR